MKNNLVPYCLIPTLLILFSCGKSGNGPAPVTPPPAPPKQDTLFSWQKVAVLTGGQWIGDICFTSASRGILTAGEPNGGNSGDIYQSIDSGKTWSKVPNSSASAMSSLFFVDDKYGFAESTTQLQITKDGGDTWSVRNFPTSSAQNIFFVNRSTGYYSDADAGVYKTIDTGKTWTNVYHPTQTRMSYYSYFLNETTGYVFSGNGTLAKTTNSAVDWQPVAQNIAASNNNTLSWNTLQFTDPLTGYYATQAGVLKTTNGGQSWTTVYPVGSSINVIKFFDANNGYYKADSAIYKTTNGGQSWTTSCRLGNDLFYGMYFWDSANGWACTAKGYIIRLAH